MAMAVEAIRTLTVKTQAMGLDKLESDLGRTTAAQNKLGEATDKTARAQEAAGRRYISAAQNIERLAQRIDPAYRAQTQLAAGQILLDRAFQQGEITGTRHAQMLTQLQQRYGQLAVANDNLIGALSRQGAAFTGLAGSLGGVTGQLGLLFPMLAGLATAKAGTDALQTAGRYETLGVVLHNVGKNAGYSADDMDRYTAAVQRSGITMSESRNTVTRLTQAQIDLTKASQLARVAQDAAVIGDTNSSEALDRIVNGIQSAHVEVLRGVGITVNFEQAYQKLATTLNKTTTDLSEQEKTQARLNIVLEAGKGIAGTYEAALGTASKQLGTMSRYTEDLLLNLGQRALPLYNTSVATAAGGLRLLSENTGLVTVALSLMAARLAAPAFVYLGKPLVAGAQAAITLATSLNTVNAALLLAQARTAALALATAALGNPVTWVTAIGAGLAIWATRTDSATDSLEAHRKIIWAVKDGYDAAGGSLEKWGKNITGTTHLETLKNLSRLQDEYKKAVHGISQAVARGGSGYSQTASFPILGQLMQDLVTGKKSLQEFRTAVSELGKADPEFRPLAESILDTSNKAVGLAKAVQEAIAAVESFSPTAAAAARAVLGLGNDMGRATGQAMTLAEAMKKIGDLIPEVKAAQKAQSELTTINQAKVQALADEAKAYAEGRTTAEQYAINIASLTAREADGIRNVTGARKIDDQIAKLASANRINELQGEARERERIRVQYAEMEATVRASKNTGSSDTEIDRQLKMIDQQRNLALANQARDAAAKAAKAAASGDSRDDYDNMVRRMQDQTRKLQEQAATYGQSAQAVARYRAEQELLVAAQRAGRDLTPQLRAEIHSIADAYALSAERVDDLRKKQQAANDLIQGFGQLGYDMFDGLISGTKSWNSAINDLTKSIIKMVMQAALMGQGPLAGMMGLSPGPGQSTGGLFGAIGGMFTPAAVHHDGGGVGQATTHRMVNTAIFTGAPSFHNGFRPDDYPAILQRGEYVLSRRDIAGIEASRAALAAPFVTATQINDNRPPPGLVVNIHNAPEGTEVTQNADGSLDVMFRQNESYQAARMARGQGPLAKTMQFDRRLRG